VKEKGSEEDYVGRKRTWHETCRGVPKSFLITGIKYIFHISTETDRLARKLYKHF
jgi:hypothetical protein